MEFGKITFKENTPTLVEYGNYVWNINEKRTVEFFEGKHYSVFLVTAEDPNLATYFTDLDDGQPISLDLEWEIEINLFQFCTSKSVLLIRHSDGWASPVIKHFLMSHKFYGKGTESDIKQLKRKFDYDFSNNIENISKTRLTPYGYSENFKIMTKQFSGEPLAEFKDKEMTFSNWAADVLTIRQVLYAAFDVVALFECYPNFKPPIFVDQQKNKKNQKKQYKPPPENKGINRKKKEMKFKNKTKKDTKRKVINSLKPVQKVYPFIIEDYSGPLNPVDIRAILETETIHDDQINDIELVSPFILNQNVLIFVAFKNRIHLIDVKKRLIGFATKVKEIPSNLKRKMKILNQDELDQHKLSHEKKDQKEREKDKYVNPQDCTFRDILFVPKVKSDILERFDEFLFCFGTNFVYEYCNHDDYVRIEPRYAQSSYLMQLFLPAMGMKVYTFPSFLPKIRVDNVPYHTTNNQLQQIFQNANSIEFLPYHTDTTPKTAIITFNTIEEADNSIASKNYSILNGNELRIARFTDEPHLRFLKLHEIFVYRDDISNSKQLRKEYEKYGNIHQAYYDCRFKIGHVTFYDKNTAIRAYEIEKDYTQFIKEGQIAVIRDLTLDVTDEEVVELCNEYGKIINISTRDLNDMIFNRFMIKEVTFAEVKSAFEARYQLLSKTFKGNALRVSVLNGGAYDAAAWKNRQRQQWIIFRNNTSPSLYQLCLKYGLVIRFEEHGSDTFAMYPTVENADAIKNDFKNLENPNIDEFVNILNPDELMFQISKIELFDRSDESPLVIVLNNIPEYTTIEDILDTCGEYKNICEVVIDKMPTLQTDDKHNNHQTFRDNNRGIVFANSKSLTGKVFNLIRTRFKPRGRIFLPIRVQYKDVPTAPQMKLITKYIAY